MRRQSVLQRKEWLLGAMRACRRAVCAPAVYRGWLAAACLCVASAGAQGEEYHVEIDKSRQQLLLRQGDLLVRRYKVALGSGGLGDKQRRGDKKTPEGVYHVTGFREDSIFDLFIQLNYPGLQDARRGYLDGRIDARQYHAISEAHRKRQLPPQNTDLGGQIGLHGLGTINEDKLFIHRNFDWTRGCVALTNREVHELRRYIRVGTRVSIRE